MNPVTSGPNLDWSNLDRYSQPITPSDLHEMGILDDVSAAQFVTGRAQFIERAYTITFAECGLLANYVEERRLYQCIDNPATGLPCESQNEWIAAFCSKSRSTWFDAKKRWKELADVPANEKIQMSRGNLIVMQALSTAVRKDPAVIEAAKQLSEADFRQKIEQEHPDQHIESVKPMHLRPEKSQAGKIEEAITMAIELDDCKTREEALEDIANFFIQERSVEYEQKRA